eukprot:GEMP01002261.1.p1 GENE.GEMP01002261.1~~GEMP01002261.1.p1  ORF type:complete len:772 (+),score=136.59 GEMP01002261.1:973-3288(+)
MHSACEVAQTLLQSKLTDLDFSWNPLNGSIFESMGQHLPMSQVAYLNLSNTVGSKQLGEDNPLTFFLRYVDEAEQLRSLNVSANRLHACDILVWENALASHIRGKMGVESINLSDNPLGANGFRSVLRSFALPRCSLKKLVMKDIDTVNVTENCGFLFTIPAEVRNFDPARPTHKAMATMLTRLQERAEGSPFVYKITTLENNVLLPTIALDTDEEKQSKVATPNLLLQEFDKTFKVDIQERNTQVMRLFQSLDHASRFLFLDALSHDFVGSVAEMEFAVRSLSNHRMPHHVHIDDKLLLKCENGPLFRSHVVAGMMICLDLTSTVQRLIAFSLCATPSVVHQVCARTKSLMIFNPRSPCGRYELNLRVPSDRCVLQTLLLLDRWEHGLITGMDISQKGNENSLLRNEELGETSFTYHRGRAMSMHDTLVFDYTSRMRAKVSSTCMSDKVFVKFKAVLTEFRGGLEDACNVMRMVGELIFVSCRQMRALTWVLPPLDATACLFNHITDFTENRDMLWATFQHHEIAILRSRLGPLATFPYAQIMDEVLEFDFSVEEDRIVCFLVLQMAANERSSLQVVSYSSISEVEMSKNQGLPRSWTTNVTRIPMSGTLKARYTCAPEHRNLNVRLGKAQEYGYFKIDPKTFRLKPWKRLDQIPEVLLLFTVNMYSMFTSSSKAFEKADTGDGQICLDEFCRFNDWSQCARNYGIEVFRHLDIGGEGTISRKEFCICDQIWAELVVLLTEFTEWLLASNDGWVDETPKTHRTSKTGELS